MGDGQFQVDKPDVFDNPFEKKAAKACGSRLLRQLPGVT
jgi:hypothetical protein